MLAQQKKPEGGLLFENRREETMNELVFLQNRQALTTSLKVADYFEKRHDNVLAAIERCKSDILNFKGVEKAFAKTTYVDAKGEKRPMYLRSIAMALCS